MDNKNVIVISLGGSLIAQEEIKTGFIKEFRDFILRRADRNRFCICVGGGRPARQYSKAMMDLGATEEERDWQGIRATRLNAELVRCAFGERAHNKVLESPSEKVSPKKDVFVIGGWKPGNSTDYVAVLLAKKYKADCVINLTNIDYVYDLPTGRQARIPADFSDAKPLEKMNWKDYRKMAGSKWSPGLSLPFDPIASQLAQQSEIKTAIINGKDLTRLENFLNNRPFIGTLIS